MPALSLDHWNVYCKDLKATVRFYERYVGLKDGDRPPFNFPGACSSNGSNPRASPAASALPAGSRAGALPSTSERGCRRAPARAISCRRRARSCMAR